MKKRVFSIIPIWLLILFVFFSCSTAEDSFSDQIVIETPISFIVLSQDSAEMTIGESFTLVATVSPSNATERNVSWSSSDYSVATVSDVGCVTAISEGSTTIMASAGDKSAVCFVTVSKQKEQTIEYQLFDKENDGIDAVLSTDGEYVALLEDIGETKQKVAIIGNLDSDNRDYVYLDSLGLIHAFSQENDIYSLLYGEENVIVFRNDVWTCDVPYELFETNATVETRASSLTRNPIYKLAEKVDFLHDLLKSPKKAILKAVLQNQLGEKDDLLNLLTDALDGIDVLEAIKWFDVTLDKYYFGNASILTLEEVKTSVCNYNLGCEVTISLENTPFYNNNSARGVSMSYTVFMVLEEDSIGGEKVIKHSPYLDCTYWFSFSDLKIGTIYKYEPKLEVEYSISDKAYWLSIGENPDTIGPQIVKKYIYGDMQAFSTDHIDCTVKEVRSETATSAEIVCSFSNVPTDAECLVKITGSISHEFKGEANKESQTVFAYGLTPATLYRASCYVLYKGQSYNGKESIDFSTLYPKGYIVSIDEETITPTSAVVKCRFDDVDSDIECGIFVVLEDGSLREIRANSQAGVQDVTISGLTPETHYVCYAFVRVPHGSGEYYSRGSSAEGFTTKPIEESRIESIQIVSIIPFKEAEDHKLVPKLKFILEIKGTITNSSPHDLKCLIDNKLWYVGGIKRDPETGQFTQTVELVFSQALLDIDYSSFVARKEASFCISYRSGNGDDVNLPAESYTLRYDEKPILTISKISEVEVFKNEIYPKINGETHHSYDAHYYIEGQLSGVELWISNLVFDRYYYTWGLENDSYTEIHGFWSHHCSYSPCDSGFFRISYGFSYNDTTRVGGLGGIGIQHSDYLYLVTNDGQELYKYELRWSGSFDCPSVSLF